MARMQRESHFLLGAAVDGSEGSLNFDVSGSTGNRYSVQLRLFGNQVQTHCTCPDFDSYAQRWAVACKHCCFVFCRALRMPMASLAVGNSSLRTLPARHWQQLCDRTQALARQSPLLDGDEQQLLGQQNKEMCVETRQSFGVELVSEQDPATSEDECAICFEKLNRDGASGQLIRCGECSKLNHRACVDTWIRVGNNETCVYCRSHLVYAMLFQADGKRLNKQRRVNE